LRQGYAGRTNQDEREKSGFLQHVTTPFNDLSTYGQP
jgi:hypothetical protein